MNNKILIYSSVMSNTLWSIDYSPPGSSVHGILQARILVWVAIPFSKGSSRPRDRTWVTCRSGSFFTIWATRKAPVYSMLLLLSHFSHVRLFVTPWLQPTRPLCPWDSPGKNSRVGCHFFPQYNIWKWKSLSRVRLFATPWTTQSMGFSRPEH